MRIGVISQWYEPESGAAAHPTAIARALAARGHQVRVLTGFPSYPFGRVYEGYRVRLRSREKRDGIELLRVADLPSHDDSAVRRAASLTSFALSATGQVGWLKDADVCLVYLTPATVGVAALALRRVWAVPYVLYVQDLWPESITASGFVGSPRANRLIEAGAHGFLRHLYGRAAGVAAISPTMAATLAKRGTREHPHSIPNWIDERVFAPSVPETPRHLDPDKTWIMYAGGIGDLQSLDTAIHAVALLDDRPDVCLALVGDGVARASLQRLATRLGLADRVRFLGHVPMERMPAVMAEAAAQLVSLRDLPVFAGTIPSKLQASMACGLPVICAVAGDAATVVQTSGAGLVAEAEDPVSLAAAMRAMAEAPAQVRAGMGARARAAYLADFSASAGASSLEALLERAARSAP